MLANKKIILCDIDGVILHGRPEDHKRWDTSLKEDLGLEPSTLQTKFFAPYWADILRGRKHLKEILPTAIPEIDSEHLIKYWFEKDSAIDHRILNLLQKQYKNNGCELYLATDQEHFRKEYIYKTLGLCQTFQDIFYSAEIGFTKNEDGYWKYVKNDLHHCMPEQMFFIDDREGNVRKAKENDIDGYVYTTFEQALIDIFST